MHIATTLLKSFFLMQFLSCQQLPSNIKYECIPSLQKSFHPPYFSVKLFLYSFCQPLGQVACYGITMRLERIKFVQLVASQEEQSPVGVAPLGQWTGFVLL